MGLNFPQGDCLTRRTAMKLATTLPLLGIAGVSKAVPMRSEAKLRMILDNDLSGDPDGLFALAHLLLSPSVDLRLIVGSHLHVGDFWDPTAAQPQNGVAKAKEILRLTGTSSPIPTLAGISAAIDDRTAPGVAARAIVTEAMREDGLPLFYAAGAGLSDLALAWKLEPRIEKRLTLVWIGGAEYEGALPLPRPGEPEYNLTIDEKAVQIIFNESKIPIWQVPRNGYRTCLISYSELSFRLRTVGELGRYLLNSIDTVRRKGREAPPPFRTDPGETYVLGDSPLVTLTALQSPFQPDAASSRYALLPAPVIGRSGKMTSANPPGRLIRIYDHIDARLTFEDMFNKFSLLDETRG